MKLVRDTPLSVGWQVWSFSAEQRRVIVTVKATLELTREGLCTLADEQAPVTGDLFWDDDVDRTLRYASDLVPVKPRGELLVSGTLRSPEPVRELSCRARVGDVETRFSVVGDRWWRSDGGVTAPQPFTAMELCWERCFGGPGLSVNPVGRGVAPDAYDVEGRVALPNIERAGRLIRSASERPEPAGAWPIPPSWPARARLMGAYDRAYARQRWPYLAEDFAWRFFQAAPPALQREGYWRGDEPIELSNLHPIHPLLRCQLPAIKPRAFLHDAERSGGPLREVGLVLDTIAIDVGEGRAFAVWRGSAPCVTESLEEIEHLYVTHEPLDQARSEAEYWEAFVARLRALWEEEQAFAAEPRPEPAPPAAEPSKVESLPGAPPSAAELHAERRREALEAGWPEPIVDQLYPSEVPERSGLDVGAVRAQLEEALRAAEGLGSPHVAESLRRMLEEHDTPPLEQPSPSGPTAEPPPDLWTAQEKRDLARRRLGQGQALAGLDLSGGDLTLLDLSGQDLRGALLMGADLRNTSLIGANIAGANLDGANLEGATLERAVLRGASLALVEASGVSFRGADLEEAVFERAMLPGADFSGVNAIGVTIEECLATQAIFEGAVLEEAEMARSNFDEANFRGASMTDARIEGASLRNACLDQIGAQGLRASDGADLSEARLRWAKLSGASFSESTLIGAKLTESDLTRASFAKARMEGAELLAVQARGASFAEARMSASSLAGADLLGARFEGAELRLADLSRANLFQSEVWRAELSDVRLDGANIEGTKLA
ncbi:MAG: DUF2169 domain-containing protein [Sandaracinaceae bacterium]